MTDTTPVLNLGGRAVAHMQCYSSISLAEQRPLEDSVCADGDGNAATQVSDDWQNSRQSHE
jgi:hypothetical protein